jgi:hypothetical protein
LTPDWQFCVLLGVCGRRLGCVQIFRVSPPRATHFSLKCAKKSKQKKAHPIIRPRLRRGSFAPSLLRGSAYMGRPWPITPLAASMLLAPLRNDCAHPPEGAIRTPERAGIPGYVRRVLLTVEPRRGRRAKPKLSFAQFHAWIACRLSAGIPVSPKADPCSSTLYPFWVTSGSGACRARPGGRTESSWKRLSDMDVARAAMGQGWPFAACLWNGDGVSEPWRSQGRMNGRRFWLLLPQK